MREKGLKPSSCNNRIRAVNAYLQWLESELRIPKLKEEQRVLPTFSVEDIGKLAAWKPKHYCERRLHTIMLTLADTGTRIDEVLSLKWTDVDYDNLLLTVTGKGSKQRKIPFSFELRKHLLRFKHEHQLVFPTRQGKKLGRRDVLRDVKRACRKLGVRAPERTLHAFRHTFAVNYLRRGGSVFHLQKCLGHSSLDMTRRYANLMTEDLQKIHQQVSLLG
jgi:integrase/recombinase XerD